MITGVSIRETNYPYLEMTLLRTKGGPVHEMGRIGPMNDLCRYLLPAGDTSEVRRIADILAQPFEYKEYVEAAKRLRGEAGQEKAL